MSHHAPLATKPMEIVTIIAEKSTCLATILALAWIVTKYITRLTQILEAEIERNGTSQTNTGRHTPTEFNRPLILHDTRRDSRTSPSSTEVEPDASPTTKQEPPV